MMRASYTDISIDGMQRSEVRGAAWGTTRPIATAMMAGSETPALRIARCRALGAGAAPARAFRYGARDIYY